MKKIFLITASLFISQFVFSQTIDSKEYLTDVTKEIITTLEDSEEQPVTINIERPSDIDLQYAEFLMETFEVNTKENIQLAVDDIDHFTPVVTINNNGKAVLKMKNEAAPMLQSDGTTLFYADSDKMISSQNALVGVRVAVIQIKK